MVTQGAWKSVIYANETFVAVGLTAIPSSAVGRVMTSTTGVTEWFLQDTGVVTQGDWKSVIYANGKFVAVGGTPSSAVGRVMTSTDGVTKWRLQNSGVVTRGAWNSVIHANGKFVAVGVNIANVGLVMTASQSNSSRTNRKPISSIYPVTSVIVHPGKVARATHPGKRPRP